MRGNLLRCAEQVKEEQKVVTAFGHPFILDVAVLGERYQGRPVRLGGIEIERTHEFEGRKVLLGRALAFPLISVDISDMTLSQITPEWARSILELTTLDHEDGRRRSYIYLHDVLYPVFIQLPTLLRSVKDRHQYLVFAPDDELAGFLKALEQMKDWFRFSSEMSLMRVNGSKNAQARKPVLTAAGIVGADWEQYNDHQFLRITLDRPCVAEGGRVWLCHMLLARILLRHGRALIGYQYMNNAYNHNPDDDLWVHVHYDAGAKVTTKHRILPKRLGDSLERMMSVLAALGLAKPHAKVD
ncbi:MAG: hypothetical protein C0434_02520 [Xanthomonadaceae bacterium]|nr:hypothetical protein [Xanthomonadaceae bacterium]